MRKTRARRTTLLVLCVPPPRAPSPPSFAPTLPAARRQSPTSVVRLIIVFAHACMMKPSPSGARRRATSTSRPRSRLAFRPAANAFFSAPSARQTGARGARCCEMRVCEAEGGSKRTTGCAHGRRRATTRGGGPGFRTQTGTLGAGGCGPARMPPTRATRTNPRTSTGVCSRVRASPFGAPAAEDYYF
jgi:hypothetical protein